MKYQHDKKEAEQELFIQAKNKMKSYIKANYKNIKQITYINDYKINPMGGISVKGYLNGNKEKEFFGLYDKTNDEIGVSSVDAEEKPECQEKECEY
ncbi:MULTISPECIES: DUF1433 domain-containing protein [Bacillus]|uniref:Uncharacterized protein n=1 Tax=Bacillus velezensis TaxID=492670 RepID=A0A411AAN8_BACVE|nr:MULTISPECIES: DUF1433 domain-containing protein [Bacillus]AHZ17471.1 hypothetical protein V529_34450 [Bacillus velezensis SQR9]AKL77910.1 hypothetical protein ABH13_3336 [Bacillus velezensis]ASB54754.1 hypothetical protein S100072_03448 [Bacillus velezensis]ASB67251.1 hypothetical protein S101413_03834 [Bacillus velezensis]ASP24147.1 DUF1433 domain-containing protein [Bacillus velezensis]